MGKITFKKQPKGTGLGAVGHPYQNVDIKYQGLVFGIIYAPNWRKSNWTIAIAVMGGDNPNCDWQWHFVNAQFISETIARQWIKDNQKWILNQKLHFFKDDEI